jgi:hypothetical protein
MKTVTNKTQKPLSIPLPRGGKLHLGPKKNGQISSEAADYGPVKRLVAAGEIEISDDGPAAIAGGGQGTMGRGSVGGYTPGRGHRSGDR